MASQPPNKSQNDPISVVNLIKLAMPKKLSKNFIYEDSVAQVEALIQQLESGELPLAETFTQFEQAVATLQQCDTYLAEKRRQVDLIIETLE